MFDRGTFLRPVAHRGLHSTARGVIENTSGAFAAAIAGGFGIECDVRPTADGRAVVFHDLELGRLVDATGKTTDHTADALGRRSYRGSSERIMRLGELLEQVAGRVPLLVEVKSEWSAADPRFLSDIADLVRAYHGPVAIMSFDPTVVAALKPMAPGVPRGIVSGLYDGSWWPGQIDEERAYRLSHLIESGPADPHFFAYHVAALPTAVTRFLREGLGIPLLAWTVRTDSHLAIAKQWADAPIFEDVDPVG
ncbi:MAG: glycerophosphodiester phosphodiesterase family protein [Hyphomicrobiaceae bacterium]|nr:glycerophosphodiester phosphodiesterase family protein [Hyphomicrobiaceae bacterium]